MIAIFPLVQSPLVQSHSMTHEHFLSVANTFLKKLLNGEEVRILDVGCGSGDMILYLQQGLTELHPGHKVELYGFEVGHHGGKKSDYLDAISSRLGKAVPASPWSERISLITDHDHWPYPTEYFDLIFSNQVLEHVRDHELFFGEIHRTLKKGGISSHLLPLRHCVIEQHIAVPFAHRFADHDALCKYIEFFARTGLMHKHSGGHKAEEVGSIQADYLSFYTNYLSASECLKLGRKYRLRTSFRHTGAFYERKIRSILGLSRSFCYDDKSSAVDFFLLPLLKYISSVSLFLEKKDLRA